jgi:hypothetical protein
MLPQMYTGLHVKYTLLFSGFNKTWTFETSFRKNAQIKHFMNNRQVGAELFLGGQTDEQGHRRDEDNSGFPQFCELA